MKILLLIILITLSLCKTANALSCTAINLKTEKNTIVFPINSQISVGSHIYLLKNNSTETILIDHVKNNANQGVSAGWSTQLHPAHWSALALDLQKKFAISCSLLKSDKYVPIDCIKSLFICTPQVASPQTKPQTNYWVAEDIPSPLFLKALENKGITVSSSAKVGAKKKSTTAVTTPILISQLPTFSSYPKSVQKLILLSEQLSNMNLTYLYGSSDPKNRGMDCSGTIYYTLKKMNINDVPRQSDQQFAWAEKNGKLYRITSNSFDSPEFLHLQPGDLLFWSGTYTTHRKSSISHVMIYLGRNVKGERVMFGASDGRTYEGKKMWGVSIFDFKLPNNKGHSRFEGYSCIPHLTC